MAPAVQITQPPKPTQKLTKMEHKRWKSDPDKRRETTAPFSYEYRFSEGRFAQLQEVHPDQVEHYSATHSRIKSKERLPRPSREDQPQRPALREDRMSDNSQTSTAPPPSPRKGDALKKALSLHGLKRRASSEVKKTPPASPYSRPEIEKLAASFGPRGPTHITSPAPTLPEPNPYGMFEQPRPAPRPPSRDMPKLSPRPEPLSATQSPQLSIRLPRPEDVPRPSHSPAMQASAFRHAHRVDSSHDAVLPPKKLPTPPRTPLVDITPPVESTEVPAAASVLHSELQPDKILKRPPPLRKKTSRSRFVEHIELKEKLSPRMADREAEQIPPVPPMVLSSDEFKLSVHGAILTTPPPDVLEFSREKRAEILADSPTIGYVQPWEQTRKIRSEETAIPEMALSSLSPIMWPCHATSNLTIKRSSSLLKALPATPTYTLGRSNTTKTRPKPIMTDLCTARMQPVLSSGIVAQGHARMISC